MTNTNDARSETFEIVERFIMECRGSGLQLPYNDLTIIAEWIACAPTTDILLVVLSEVIPDYFESRAQRRVPPTLKGLDKKVKQMLAELAKRRLSAFAEG